MRGTSNTIRFNGTGIRVEGARCPQCGTFDSFLDGNQTVFNENLKATRLVPQTVLYEVKDLDEGFHEFRLVNGGGRLYFDRAMTYQSS